MGEWDESKHTRGSDGRFGGQEAFVAKRAERYAGPLSRKAEKEGGFTVKPGGGKDRIPKDGIMVSRDPKEGHGHVVEIAKMALRDPPPTESEVREEIRSAVKTWLEKALPSIQKLGSDHHLGGWFERDKKTNQPIALHLDISQRFDPRHKEDAIKTGRERNQLAVWDIGKGEEIDTGGTGR